MDRGDDGGGTERGESRRTVEPSFTSCSIKEGTDGLSDSLFGKKDKKKRVDFSNVSSGSWSMAPAARTQEIDTPITPTSAPAAPAATEHEIKSAPTGAERTELHASNPDGWAAGEYQVEILLDGRSVETLDFEVFG